ncbi:MAG: transposase [Bacteroidetes bacterium]|nr:transposase [Bacteroidota bacterium]
MTNISHKLIPFLPVFFFVDCIFSCSKLNICLFHFGVINIYFSAANKTKQKSPFTELCISNKIDHRQTLAYHPWTNGQVERINGTIKSTTIKKYYYENHEKLQNHLDRFLNAYNYARPLKTLKGSTPYEKVLLYLSSEKGESKINPIYKSPGPNI